MYLAEIPVELHKHQIITSEHLVNLEDHFAESSFALHHYLDDNLFEASLRVCPDVLLHHSDEYLAALINKMIQDNTRHRNIFVLCGYG